MRRSHGTSRLFGLRTWPGTLPATALARRSNAWPAGSETVDADVTGLELGRPRLWVVGLDRELIGVDVVGKVHRHEGQPGPEPRIDPHRCEHTAASRAHPHRLALAQPERDDVGRRQIDGLAEAQRRAEPSRLHAGVVGVEPATGGEA